MTGQGRATREGAREREIGTDPSSPPAGARPRPTSLRFPQPTPTRPRPSHPSLPSLPSRPPSQLPPPNIQPLPQLQASTSSSTPNRLSFPPTSQRQTGALRQRSTSTRRGCWTSVRTEPSATGGGAGERSRAWWRGAGGGRRARGGAWSASGASGGSRRTTAAGSLLSVPLRLTEGATARRRRRRPWRRPTWRATEDPAVRPPASKAAGSSFLPSRGRGSPTCCVGAAGPAHAPLGGRRWMTCSTTRRRRRDGRREATTARGGARAARAGGRPGRPATSLMRAGWRRGRRRRRS